MTIASIDDWMASKKQLVEWNRTASRATVTGAFFALMDMAGQPGLQSLPVGNTANGIVPTDAGNGYPTLNNFDVGAKGYLTRVNVTNTVAARMYMFDRLFCAGQYAYNNGTTNLASQPGFSARLPVAGDYKGLELWIEVATQVVASTAFTVTVGYTNQDGVSGRSTGANNFGGATNLTLGRSYQLPLQAGDTGVQKIDSVTVTHTAATAGAINVSIMRPLWTGRVAVANGGDNFDLIRTGMPEVFEDTAFYILVAPDSTASGLPEVSFEVSNK